MQCLLLFCTRSQALLGNAASASSCWPSTDFTEGTRRKVEVLLGELGDHRFRAWTSRPFELSVEGATADESVASLKQLLNDRLSRVHVIEVGASAENPLKAIVGKWRDSPLVDEVIEHNVGLKSLRSCLAR